MQMYLEVISFKYDVGNVREMVVLLSHFFMEDERACATCYYLGRSIL